MNFQDALKELQAGKCVKRSQWHYTNTAIALDKDTHELVAVDLRSALMGDITNRSAITRWRYDDFFADNWVVVESSCKDLDFNEAMQYVKRGAMVRRPNWNSHVYVTQELNAILPFYKLIGFDIRTSLQNLAEDYHPTVEDITATDWYVAENVTTVLTQGHKFMSQIGESKSEESALQIVQDYKPLRVAHNKDESINLVPIFEKIVTGVVALKKQHYCNWQVINDIKAGLQDIKTAEDKKQTPNREPAKIIKDNEDIKNAAQLILTSTAYLLTNLTTP